MTTQHTQSPVSKQAPSHELTLSAAKHKPVSIDFHNAQVSSDGGLLVLREIENHLGVVATLANTIRDRRHSSYIDHSLYELLAQRIGQIACGYEDANDSDALRSDSGVQAFCRTLAEQRSGSGQSADDDASGKFHLAHHALPRGARLDGCLYPLV